MGRPTSTLTVLACFAVATSSPALAQPPTPSSCNVTPGTYAGLDITWSDVAGEDGYRVYRDGELITIVGVNVTSFLDLEITGGGNYCVEAFNSGGTSGQCCQSIVLGTAGPTIDPKDQFHDTFPANETAGLPGTAFFDTASAHVKTGRNIAQTTGDLLRYSVPGDSLVATSPVQPDIRMDLMFRIRPGVGNYITVGNVSSGLRGNPTSALPAGAGHFWNSFGAAGNPGTFSGLPGAINTAVAIVAHGNAGGWSPIVWNSARMDTAESHALFPAQMVNVGNPPSATKWSATFHETELAARPTLGIARNRCFLVNPAIASIDDANMNCGMKAPYPPTWVNASAGWNGTTTTTEGTKILPDGLFTPGTSVQYFIRRQITTSPTSSFTMCPDTSAVLPQLCESSLDCKRWSQFSVLPNRWNSTSFGGAGDACMLVVDLDDGGGAECAWTNVADSIAIVNGLCAAVGQGRGWGPAGLGDDINDPTNFIPAQNAQPGVSWDLYNVLGGSDVIDGHAADVGGRLAYRAQGFLMDDGTLNGFGTGNNGKWTYNAPTLEMLNTYYRLILILSGDQSVTVIGPQVDRTGDDVAVLQNWLASGNTAAADRGIWVQGSGFVEAAMTQGPPQSNFVMNYLGATLKSGDYRTFSGDINPSVTVKTTGVLPTTLHGVKNTPSISNDVLDVFAPLIGTSVAAEYNSSSNYPASIHKSHSATFPWIAVTDGWNTKNAGSPFLVSSEGRRYHMQNVLTAIFSPFCNVSGAPQLGTSAGACPTVDVPREVWDAYFGMLGIRNNPVHAGEAIIDFQVDVADELRIDVFDVAGRQVRTLAQAEFQAGRHEVRWDGMDDAGIRASRGVYFARIRSLTRLGSDARRVTILR